MGMHPTTTIFESYQSAEREVLTSWEKYPNYTPMPATDQAIIVAAAARLLYNVRQQYTNVHGFGGSGAIELILALMKRHKTTPAELVDRLGESVME